MNKIKLNKIKKILFKVLPKLKNTDLLRNAKLERIHWAGYIASKEGKDKTDNPYDPYKDSIRSYYWLDGWQDGVIFNANDK